MYSSKTYFILSGVFAITCLVLLLVNVHILAYGFLGTSIGAVLRGFYVKRIEG